MEIKNSLLAEAIDRLTDLGKKTTEPTTILANGRTFLVTGTSCEEIDPIEKPQPDKATTASLNALVALLRNEVDKEYTHCPLYVSCGWYDRVRVFTQPDEGDDLHRFTLYEAVDRPAAAGGGSALGLRRSPDQAPLHVPEGTRGRH